MNLSDRLARRSFVWRRSLISVRSHCSYRSLRYLSRVQRMRLVCSSLCDLLHVMRRCLRYQAAAHPAMVSIFSFVRSAQERDIDGELMLLNDVGHGRPQDSVIMSEFGSETSHLAE
jgi:hypothetical protein